MLVRCSTSTRLSYNSAPFCEPIPPGSFVGTSGHKGSPSAAPASSCYLNHRACQPAYQFGLRMPWPAAGPDVCYSPRESGYSHLMRAERFFHVSLDQVGFDYDVVPDLDLHRDPELLSAYRAVVINGHNEYCSTEACDGLDRFLSNGGSAVVLSGNTLFWQTTFSVNSSVMECRNYDEKIGGRQGAQIGELYHSHDGRRGSLLRECGSTVWKVIGLKYMDWEGADSRSFGVHGVGPPNTSSSKAPKRWVWPRAPPSVTVPIGGPSARWAMNWMFA